MIRPSGTLPVYLYTQPVDMRKQSAGLAALVQGELGGDPFATAIFGFTNRRRTQCRLLMWERNGFVLWTKRLEQDRFHWPSFAQGSVDLSVLQLNWLLDGLDLSRWRPHAQLHFDSVF